jgi:hypothetical protein
MELKEDLNVPLETWRFIAPLLNSESHTALVRTGMRLIEREKLFAKHQEALQSDGSEPNPDYMRWKQKKRGTSEKFVFTGEAKAALTSLNADMRMTAGSRRIQIFLRKMIDAKKGRINVYAVAQRGHFRGLTKKKQKAQWSEAIRRGLFHEKLEKYAEKHFDRTERKSTAEYPITVNLVGDDAIAEKVLSEEAGEMMRKRGA